MLAAQLAPPPAMVAPAVAALPRAVMVWGDQPTLFRLRAVLRPKGWRWVIMDLDEGRGRAMYFTPPAATTGREIARFIVAVNRRHYGALSAAYGQIVFTPTVAGR